MSYKSVTPLYYAQDRRFYWGHCWYCGIELIWDKKLKRLANNSFTRDHILPMSFGGGRVHNTVPACNQCNQNKKNLTLEQFRSKRFGKNKKLFYGEEQEHNLQGIAVIPEYVPKTVKCFVRRELILSTPLICILRRLFS